ncbi:MAG: hypothetical protein FWH07_07800 [Oscillospiraceae bacterium]|nr:hypothetical protein [Oscillospiraceae bacterium]
MSKVVIDILIGTGTGIISGIMASVVFFLFLMFVRPKINISDKICRENSTNIFRIKIVNKTHSMLMNVKYTLYYCQKSGDGVYVAREISATETDLYVISKYSKKDINAEYAVRVKYEIDDDICISNGWLEFTICASHGFSNTSTCIKKRYSNSDISTGIFETGTSMRILAIPVPAQNTEKGTAMSVIE